jgi:uncharacterized membrane protein
MSVPAAAPPPAARHTRAAALAALLLLVALGLAWELWLAPLRAGGSWWALKVLPLLPALPGLLRYRMHTYRWLALLVWLYFTEGVVRAFSERPPAATLALLEVLLALALFVACTAHVRLRQKAARASAQTLEAS